ncbi:MAG: hypothetical protein ABI634_16095, partial [Acidobacteriota bacterium]
LLAAAGAAREAEPSSFLKDHFVVAWYGNPRSTRMGILGVKTGADRADGLRKQAAGYATLTSKQIVMAYHLIVTIAQPLPGKSGDYRRRETPDTIQAMLDEARANGFRLILDVQAGGSTVAEEVQVLEPFLSQPDVDLALDPEFTMPDGVVPGKRIGTMRAAEVNGALDFLERTIRAHKLPPKMLIVHQFTENMLPDKGNIRKSSIVDLVLDMDGFGDQPLKRSTWRFAMKQPLAFAAIKLFYQEDTNVMTPAQVMALTPPVSVVIYQ